MRTLTLILTTVMAIMAMGCGEEFDARNLVQGYRVIGIEADLPEPSPDDTVKLVAHDFDSDGKSPSYQWTLCLYSFGSTSDYACVDPSLKIEIGTTQAIEIDLGPDGIDFRSRFEAAGDIYNVSGEIVTLEKGHIVYVELNSEVEGGRHLRVIKRLTLRDTDGERNINPTIETFEVEGEALVGGKVKLSVTVPDGTRQTYENFEGKSVKEELLYTWYTTAGEFDPGLTFEADNDTKLELPDTPGPVEVWVAVRDGRGGLALRQQTIMVSAP